MASWTGTPDRTRRVATRLVVPLLVLAGPAGLAGTALARGDTAPVGLWEGLGRYHPVLVHFPVALILAAAIAELVGAIRRDERLGDAARIMVTAAAWLAVPAAIAGFARASSLTFDTELERVFVVHRVAGIATPVLAFLAAGLAAGVRRTGQVWELILYRVVLVIAAICVGIAGHHGGQLVYGAGFFRWW